MAKKKVILAYSGGLDTSVILKWLLEKGYDVVAYCADVGQQEDYAALRRRALSLGASKVYAPDLRAEFVTEYVWFAIRSGAVYEGRYLLGTSLARPLIAKKHVEIARRENTRACAHGATGKGNDQLRFELAYLTLLPEAEIISPWKDPEFLAQFPGRDALLDYAESHGIEVPVKKGGNWSMDNNLFHISFEGGDLEDPMTAPRGEMFKLTRDAADAPDKPALIEIEFEKGNPVALKDLGTGKRWTSPVSLLENLNRIAGTHGIGRIDVVENRFVGMKSRGVYETPGGTVLHAAHRDLEGITLDREVMHLRDMLIPRLAEVIYNGFWFSPEMEFLRNAFDHCQEFVTGVVRLRLFKGSAIAIGRRSYASMYDSDMASMVVPGNYSQTDAWGFIRLNAMRLRKHHLQKQAQRTGRRGK
jgi:argininosuccinate synthase